MLKLTVKFLIPIFFFCVISEKPLCAKDKRIEDELMGLTVTVTSGKREFNRNKEFFKKFNKKEIPSGILFEGIVSPNLSEKYNGFSPDLVELSIWKQLYSDLYYSYVEQPELPEPKITFDKTLNFLERDPKKDNQVKIGILQFNFSRLKAKVFERNILKIQNKEIFDVPTRNENPFEEKQIFAAAALRNRPYGHLTLKFMLDKEFYFTNTNKKNLNSFEIDFNDGLGFRKIKFDESVTVTYKTPGKKEIILRNKDEKEILESHFLIEIYDLKRPTAIKTSSKVSLKTASVTTAVQPDIQYSKWQNLASKYPYLGEFGHYDLWVLLGSENGVPHTKLINPVLLVEGFDPDGKHDFYDIYNYITRPDMQDIGGQLLSEGRDLIILNYGYGADYIQRNGLCVASAIQVINDELSATNVKKDLDVIGVSMGGLTTRYGLCYLEKNNIEHHVKLWMTLDSPHNGANIPLGLQHYLRFFATMLINPITAAIEGLGFIRSPAARQMLIAHLDAPNVVNEQLRIQFWNDLYDLGNYPQKLRKVAISDGSGAATFQIGNQGQSMLPGTQIVFYDFRSYIFGMEWLRNEAYVWALANNDQDQKVFYGFINTALYEAGPDTVIVLGRKIPYDSMAGGYTDTTYLAVNVKTSFGQPTSDFYNHSFIPSSSAIGVSDYFSWDRPLKNEPTLSQVTPFDAVYISEIENADHTNVTPAISKFIKDQLTYSDVGLRLENRIIRDSNLKSKESVILGPKISVGKSISVEAGQEIIFEPGFDSEQGVSLDAKIMP